MFLLTMPGERHEGHIPIILLQDMKAVNKWLGDNSVYSDYEIVKEPSKDTVGEAIVFIEDDELEEFRIQVEYFIFQIEPGQILPRT